MFHKRFFLLIIVVPFATALLLAAALISQVVQLEPAEWLRLLAIWLASYGAASVVFMRRVSAAAGAVQRARTSAELSRALSECLGVTSNGSNAAWLGGGLAFTLLATLFVTPSITGVTTFAVAALLDATLVIVFVYAAAKRMIGREAERLPGVAYTGTEIRVARKLGVIFIGVFVASIATLVTLVSARVSLSLERRAIASAESDFTSSLNIARGSKRLSDEELQRLDMYLASRYLFFRIDPNGRVTSSQRRSREALTADELRRIRARRNGDSASFVAPHVLRFAELPDGSILAMRIPWDHYRAVPRQILFYALVVAALTLVIFAVATYFLATDLTAPLRRVRQLSLDLADGNFATDVSIFTDDEISSVAKGVATTRENLRLLIGAVGGSGTTISVRVREMSAGSASLVEVAREQSSLTTTSVQALMSVKGGAESVLQTSAAVAQRAGHASASTSQLAAASVSIAQGMESLFESVEQISSTSTSIGRAAEAMSFRTGSIAGASDQVVAYVAEMDATVEELRRTAAATAELSRQVDANASSGVTAVERTVQGIEVARRTTGDAASVMRQLAESTSQISHILSIIEDVASRTNMLSLNAAIIAAQAGQQGAGFQVVAEEIRTLADQTKSSTKEISAIVNAIQRNSRGAIQAIEKGVTAVEQSVVLAHEASSSLGTIQESAAASLMMSERTTKALDEQARAARHLHEVVTRFAEDVQEIDRGARDHAGASISLGRENDRVRSIVLDVHRSTGRQSDSAAAITQAMQDVAGDIASIRDQLATQLADTAKIAAASDQILELARRNDHIASNFGGAVGDLLDTAGDFERAVTRFRL